jgi:prepilin-type N-terminal cleavage/methylation domain-containing protein
MRRSAGFTMIEMMFVVVVIAVLAAVAVIAYTKSMNKARASEVPTMFGELKSREEAYKAEFGTYLPACVTPDGSQVGGVLEDCTEGDYWPTPLQGKGNRTDSSVPPARFQTLRVSIPSAGLYCQYEVVAGPSGDNTKIGTTGQILFGVTAPVRAWYYLMAQCDWDGDPTVNATFWQRDDLTDMGRDNELR